MRNTFAAAVRARLAVSSRLTVALLLLGGALLFLELALASTVFRRTP